MNDEINHEVANKTVAVVFRTARLTGDTLQRALRAYLNSRNAHRNINVRHGKMKVKDLVGQGQGAVSIDIADGNLRTFERVARKYNVDFAVKKDKSVDPPKYMIFFKGKDQDVISQAFKEYVHNNEKRKQRVSVRQKLQTFKRAINLNKNRERTRDINRNRSQSL